MIPRGGGEEGHAGLRGREGERGDGRLVAVQDVEEAARLQIPNVNLILNNMKEEENRKRGGITGEFTSK